MISASSSIMMTIYGSLFIALGFVESVLGVEDAYTRAGAELGDLFWGYGHGSDW
jgi:hypothetical protein